MADAALLRDQVEETLRTIYDPEIPVNIFELGLIYKINILPEDHVQIYMTLTAPACPAAGQILQEVEDKVKVIPDVKSAEVRLTFEPPWDKEMMSDEAKLELGWL